MQTLTAVHRRHLLIAWAPLVMCPVGGIFFHAFVVRAIQTNVILNSIILGTALCGAALMLLRIRAIRREWLVFQEFAAWSPEAGASAEHMQSKSVASRLLAHLSNVRHARGVSAIEHSQIQEELEDARGVLESRQEATQYIVGLMIALGVVGILIALLETLIAVGNLIGGFATNDASQDMGEDLAKLIGNLQYPLTILDTAFSASIFGLLGSVMLGIMMLSVRAFQVEFLQFARLVAHEIMANTLTEYPQSTLHTQIEDSSLWAYRATDLQKLQKSLQVQVRQLVAQTKTSEERQLLLLTHIESLLAVARKNESRVHLLEEYLSTLPLLLQKVVEGQGSASRLIEIAQQTQRQSELQQQALARSMIQQLSELASQAGLVQTEQSRRTHSALLDLLDQHIVAVEEHRQQADLAQRSSLYQQEVLESIFNVLSLSSTNVNSQIDRLHADTKEQTNAMQNTSRVVASALVSVTAQLERLTELLVAPRSDIMAAEVAYEVSQGAERLERELGAGIAAVLSVLSELKPGSSTEQIPKPE